MNPATHVQRWTRRAKGLGINLVRERRNGIYTVGMKSGKRSELFGTGYQTRNYLKRLGVADLPPSTSPFDPGYDPATIESHLEQSSHLMSTIKLSMACWIVADEKATRRKVAAARRYGVPTVTGAGPFKIAVARGELMAYLDLCADIGITRIECGQGFTEFDIGPVEAVTAAKLRGLEVQAELGKKRGMLRCANRPAMDRTRISMDRCGRRAGCRGRTRERQRHRPL
jgi:hypothetical protein